MADILEVATYEQIQQILSHLETNYSNISSAFYDVFYNPVPQDVTLKMFDESGTLKTYVIPNRAKDFRNILNGEGSPEGSVEGTLGSTYQDTENGDIYIKETEDGSEGWDKIATEDYLKTFLIRGTGSPEGNISGNKGILYVDTSNADLYIKTTITGNIGWVLVTSAVPTTKYANRDLSNLTSRGEDRFNVKENKSNKVTSISSESTDVQYPSAKCVFDNVNDKLTFEIYDHIVVDI